MIFDGNFFRQFALRTFCGRDIVNFWHFLGTSKFKMDICSQRSSVKVTILMKPENFCSRVRKFFGNFGQESIFCKTLDAEGKKKVRKNNTIKILKFNCNKSTLPTNCLVDFYLEVINKMGEKSDDFEIFYWKSFFCFCENVLTVIKFSKVLLVSAQTNHVQKENSALMVNAWMKCQSKEKFVFLLHVQHNI